MFELEIYHIDLKGSFIFVVDMLKVQC